MIRSIPQIGCRPATFRSPLSLLMAFSLVVSTGFSLLHSTPGHAESLFRAGIAYQTSQPYSPGSLFTLPRAKTIGDMVTITIAESNQVVYQSNNNTTKNQSLTENTTSILNRIGLHLFNRDNILPSVSGLDVQDKSTLRAQNQKVYTFKDSITCQVVQVLPNGFLVVQGRKQMFQSKDRQDLIVSGIVNPYQLTANNSVPSTMVANLNVQVTGRGPTERREGDGIIGKYFRVFN